MTTYQQTVAEAAHRDVGERIMGTRDPRVIAGILPWIATVVSLRFVGIVSGLIVTRSGDVIGRTRRINGRWIMERPCWADRLSPAHSLSEQLTRCERRAGEPVTHVTAAEVLRPPRGRHARRH